MLQARPLYDSDPDARLFVAPAVWTPLVGALRHRFNVALVGPRGAGKTSALRQLQRRLRADGVRAVFVDATGVADLEQLVAAIENELVGRRARRASRARPRRPRRPGGPPGAASLRVLQRIRDLAAHPPTVILVDCAHGARAAHDLFGRMRDELWQMEHRWVVAVEDSERSILLAPPADAFFDQVLSLTMTGAELLEVLRRRDAGLPDGTLRRIAAQTATPRAALQAVRDALLDPAGDDPLAATLWRQEHAAALGRPHSMAMHELEALGGASASDAEFLRRLGWTRGRASQVLGELAEAKLVTPSDEKTPAAGRPRRIFRPAAPPVGA